MPNSDLQQVLAVHDAYGAMLVKLLHTLVQSGALTPKQGAEVIDYGRAKLAETDQCGELVTLAVQGFAAMADEISPAVRRPRA